MKTFYVPDVILVSVVRFAALNMNIHLICTFNSNCNYAKMAVQTSV